MSVSFSTIRPGLRLADQVAGALEAEIRSGGLAAGQKLPTEQALVQQFGVSRTVVREAVQQLKSRGLVDSRQGSGVYVLAAGCEPLSFEPTAAASREAVLQIIELRRALEAEVAELAAQRRTPAQARAIRQALQAIADAVAGGGDGAVEDVRFHRAIGEAAGNPFLIRTLDYLAQFLQGVTRVTRANEARHREFAEQVKREHEAVVQAIEAGDAPAARHAAAQHMNNAMLRLQHADASFWRQDGARLAAVLVPPTMPG
ncbi:GntR family transcriptional regulator [Rubrivivax gelatinosus]|nr:GntR family transcriptional regulator [Rubrivivax gelatinosus]